MPQADPFTFEAMQDSIMLSRNQIDGTRWFELVPDSHRDLAVQAIETVSANYLGSKATQDQLYCFICDLYREVELLRNQQLSSARARTREMDPAQLEALLAETRS